MSHHTVRYRLTEPATPCTIGVLTARPRAVAHDDETFTMRVAVHPGYTEVSDIPRIVATNHPFGRTTPENVELIDVTTDQED